MKLHKLLDSALQKDNAWEVDIPKNWMQGRTAYGGLSAALCLQTVRNEAPQLPPLRSALINFIGPAGGKVSIANEVLRQGRSTTAIDSRMSAEKGIATQATFWFGCARESTLDFSYSKPPECASPADSEDFFMFGQRPQFTQNFECRLAYGARPVSGSKQHDHCLWVRLEEPMAVSEALLLAIGDMPPPAVMAMSTELAPNSSINWAVNFIHERPSTEDGWWLLRSKAEHAQHGYSSQDMQLWNSSGELVLTSRQSVAIFY